METAPPAADEVPPPPLTPARRRFVLGFVRPWRWRLLLLLFLLLLTTGLSLLTPVFTEKAIDRGLKPPGDFGVLAGIAAAMLAASILRFGLGLIQEYQFTSVTARVLLRMRQAFFEHLERLPLRWFTRARTGDVLSRLTRDLSEIQGAATGAFLSLGVSVLTLLLTVGLLLAYEPWLFLLSGLLLPVALLVARMFRTRLIGETRGLREANADLAAYLVETLSSARHVRTHGRERSEARRFLGRQRALLGRILRYQILSALAQGVPGLLVGLSAIVVLLYGGWRVIRFQMELGDLIAFSMLQSRLFQPLQGLVALYLQLQRARVSVDRVCEIMEMPGENLDPPDATPLPPVAGAVTFEKVGFAYDPGHPVLSDISFRVAPGETVAIVGRSGAGKSTLMDLLLRLHAPTEGRILIDGHDIAGATRQSLVRQVAVVAQDPVLLHASLLENLRYGRPDASVDAVRSALEAVGLLEFAEALPDGLGTPVGERGARLSGGQRQRVAIARALLKDPRILILDEATSSLEASADRAILAALRRLMAGRTTFIVTHRTSGILDADRVLVLDGGRVAESGDHATLLATGTVYPRLLGPEATA